MNFFLFKEKTNETSNFSSFLVTTLKRRPSPSTSSLSSNSSNDRRQGVPMTTVKFGKKIVFRKNSFSFLLLRTFKELNRLTL